MDTDLLAPPFAQAAHAIAANDRQYDSVLVAPEDTKAQNRTAAMAAEGATTLYWQHSKNWSSYTDQHARQWHGHQAITLHRCTRRRTATFLVVTHYGHSSHLIGRGFSTDRTKCTVTGRCTCHPYGHPKVTRGYGQHKRSMAAELPVRQYFVGPPVCLSVVSRPVELSLQSSLQLSLTVLVCYRSRCNI